MWLPWIADSTDDRGDKITTVDSSIEAGVRSPSHLEFFFLFFKSSLSGLLGGSCSRFRKRIGASEWAFILLITGLGSSSIFCRSMCSTGIWRSCQRIVDPFFWWVGDHKISSSTPSAYPLDWEDHCVLVGYTLTRYARPIVLNGWRIFFSWIEAHRFNKVDISQSVDTLLICARWLAIVGHTTRQSENK